MEKRNRSEHPFLFLSFGSFTEAHFPRTPLAKSNLLSCLHKDYSRRGYEDMAAGENSVFYTSFPVNLILTAGVFLKTAA